MSGRRLGVVAVLALALAGCGGSASRGLQDRVVDITQAANDRDADALRAAADDLIEDVDASAAAGEISSAEAARLTGLARQLQADADLIDQDLLDAETARREAEAAEEAAKQAEEARKKAEEEARKAREEAEKGKGGKGEKDEDKDEGDG